MARYVAPGVLESDIDYEVREGDYVEKGDFTVTGIWDGAIRIETGRPVFREGGGAERQSSFRIRPGEDCALTYVDLETYDKIVIHVYGGPGEG